MSEEIVKICKKHGVLTKNLVRPKKHINGKYYLECLICVRHGNKVRGKKSKDKHRDKVRKNQREYYFKNREKILEWQKTTKKNHFSRYQAYARKTKQKSCKNVDHMYIKDLIRKRHKLKVSDMTNELVQAYTVFIKLKRKLRRIKDGDNKC